MDRLVGSGSHGSEQLGDRSPEEPRPPAGTARRHRLSHGAVTRNPGKSRAILGRGLTGRPLYRPEQAQAAASLRDDIGLLPDMTGPNARGSSTPVRTAPSSGSINPTPGRQPDRALPGARSHLPLFRQKRGPMRRGHAQPGGIPWFLGLSGETSGAPVIVPKTD